MTREEFFKDVICNYKFTQQAKSKLGLTFGECFILFYFMSHDPCIKRKEVILKELDISHKTYVNNTNELIERGFLKRDKLGGNKSIFTIDYDALSLAFKQETVVIESSTTVVIESSITPPPVVIESSTTVVIESSTYIDSSIDNKNYRQIDRQPVSDARAIFNLWNEKVLECKAKYPACKISPSIELTGHMKNGFKLFTKKYFKDLEAWSKFFDLVLSRRFLRGEVPGKSYAIGLTDLLVEAKIAAILEGKYADWTIETTKEKTTEEKVKELNEALSKFAVGE